MGMDDSNRKRRPFMALWSYHIRGHKSRGHRETSQGMCRNIKTLFNFDPPVTEDEVRAASLQFVRKISGFNKPSKANEASFSAAVDEVAGYLISPSPFA